MSFFSSGPPSDADHGGYDDEGKILKSIDEHYDAGELTITHTQTTKAKMEHTIILETSEMTFTLTMPMRTNLRHHKTQYIIVVAKWAH